MAANINPSSPAKSDMRMPMPMPPPLLHTRSGNEAYERPQTPTSTGFTSPVQTPQGSPSKNRLPPGANDLPNVLDHALKLDPNSPTKKDLGSPGKQGLSVADENVSKDPFRDSVIHDSPRKYNKENTPPGGYRFGKDMGIQQNPAALSRQEPYQSSDSRKAQSPIRGLTAEELEKLQLPKVKRMANVTQLCRSHGVEIAMDITDKYRLS